MPRTPLLQSLQRLARDHVIAEKKNVSVATVQDWRAELLEKKRATRRAFIKGAALATAALAAPKVRAATQPSIAIIGGGIAGLSCALELADAGLASTVYE